MDSKDLVPLVDVAQQLGFSWERTWRAVLRGELKGVKLGGRWYVRQADVDKFAAAAKSVAKPQA